MTSWLGKSWWQGISVVVAILLTVVGLWWQQSRKELSYEVVSQTSLVSLEDPTAQQLQVLFNGKPVADVSLIVLRVQNTGNVPIPTADYEKQLTFRFGQGVEILSAEVTSMTPPNLGASINAGSNSVELLPVLLNNGDELLLKALVSGAGVKIDADARIIGVRGITERKPGTLSTNSIIIFIIITIMLIIITFSLFRVSANTTGNKRFILSVLAITSFIITFSFGMSSMELILRSIFFQP